MGYIMIRIWKCDDHHNHMTKKHKATSSTTATESTMMAPSATTLSPTLPASSLPSCPTTMTVQAMVMMVIRRKAAMPMRKNKEKKSTQPGFSEQAGKMPNRPGKVEKLEEPRNGGRGQEAKN